MKPYFFFSSFVDVLYGVKMKYEMKYENIVHVQNEYLFLVQYSFTLFLNYIIVFEPLNGLVCVQARKRRNIYT